MRECPVCRRCYPDEVNHCPQDGDETTPSLLGEPTLDARYLLERRLGQGGMGVVFQARHIFLKTSHAIKVILPDLVGNDPMLTTRFRQEALAAAAIRHQNIIAVTDFGVVRGTMPFLVMEFVKGRSLQEILASEGAMPPQRAWEFISAIAAGVGAAHRQNIVHRDLKPLNIMVQDDVPVSEGLKILDFGLAKIKSGELLGSFVQAQTSGLMGSPFYMAPEQWSDEEPDARADIYSLGVILYQMLSGEVPFKGSSIPSIMKKHLTLPPPSFHSMGVSVPPAIEAVVRHALEKEVEARIDSIPSFLRELHAALNSSPVVAAALRKTIAMDPNRTIASTTQPEIKKDLTATQPPIAQETNFGTSLGSLAGTISDAQLDKRIDGDAQRKQREEEERQKQERDRREQEQQEKLERMALQAKELEDRLERLSGSMPPAMDPEATHVQGGTTNRQWAADSVPGGSVGPGKQQMIVDFSPKRKGLPPLLYIGAAVFVLFLAGVGITAYMMMRPGVRPADPTPTPTPVAPPKVKAELLPIDGGTFQMGRKNGPLQETPAHLVTVESFLMDRTEVTNTEYAEFVRETNHAAPSHWVGNKPAFGQEQWPIVNVSFDDATAFAAWRSKRDGVSYRLPTEQEWEYAARNGEQSDLYPWGPEWKDKAAVVKDATPAAVGSRPEGKNKWGVFDLIGNVWEWTSSKVSVYPGNPTKIPASAQDWVSIRGGCYVSDPSKSDTPVTACLREFVPPSTKTTLLGFRLVRNQ
ncbi:MAG TPA: SUMF1/EgtB/PvdO family nonheme iron enzyme [Pyrinomonadaceae bacterium]|nr:SUMF1/EgtB/PvdO family nonheme iron enzyme [Pyrinomonadaceae bacterium]